MKRTLQTVFGLALIAAGVIGILAFSGIINLTFSIDGWWALFIIIPSLGTLLSRKDVTGSLIGLGIGISLLLAARGVIEWSKIWMYILAVVAIGIGIRLVFNIGCRGKGEMKIVSENGKELRHIENSFGQQKMSFDGEKVEGLSVENSFGAMTLDLRGAVIENDIDIKVEVSFGALEIYVPEGHIVKTAVSSGFGGVTDKRMSQGDSSKPLIIITGECGFAELVIR